MRSLSTTALLITTMITATATAKYEAHEWGTFTSLVGSNGITQHGLYHEDEALPSFVHGFGAIQADKPVTPAPRPPCHSKMCFGEDFFSANVVTQKMETPVIYFYGDAGKVSVNVRFPEGVVTDTYPAPKFTSPTRADLKKLGNGNTTFEVDILPKNTFAILPIVPQGNIYGHARNVASNNVRSGNETERFIFYRGIGRFQPRFGITSKNGELRIRTNPASEPIAAFLVHVDGNGNGQLMNLKDGKDRLDFRNVSTEELARLMDHSRIPVSDGDPVSTGVMANQKLIQALQHAGLFADEAKAMVDTWEHGYLKVPGLRILYVLPKDEVEQVLPLTMSPAPERLERVFVGRIEVLLDTEEDRILSRILTERQAFQVTSLGRFAEAMLRRVEQVYVEKAQLTGGVNVADQKLLQQLIQISTKSEMPSGLL